MISMMYGSIGVLSALVLFFKVSTIPSQLVYFSHEHEKVGRNAIDFARVFCSAFQHILLPIQFLTNHLHSFAHLQSKHNTNADVVPLRLLQGRRKVRRPLPKLRRRRPPRRHFQKPARFRRRRLPLPRHGPSRGDDRARLPPITKGEGQVGVGVQAQLQGIVEGAGEGSCCGY